MGDLLSETISALGEMDPLVAEVVYRRYTLGEPHQTVAEKLGLPLSDAEQIAFLGLKQVKERVFPKEKQHG